MKKMWSLTTKGKDGHSGTRDTTDKALQVNTVTGRQLHYNVHQQV